jgi:hypothetical protein
MNYSGSNIASSGLVKNGTEASNVSYMKKTRFDDGSNVIRYRVTRQLCDRHMRADKIAPIKTRRQNRADKFATIKSRRQKGDDKHNKIEKITVTV